jgi:hypothetical protein
MPILHLGPLARVAALAVAPILLAGCGQSTPPGQTVDDAGHLLKVQTYKFLFATTAADVKATDELYDKYIPCGNNLFKLTYAVAGRPASNAATGSAKIRSASDKAVTPSEIIDDLVDFVPQVGTFNVAERRSGDPTVKLVNAQTKTHLTLHSPAPNRLMITGETDCLRKAKVRTH